MRLIDLVKLLGGSLSPEEGRGLKVTGVHLDSRQVGAGDLFVALPGSKQDGGSYAREAIRHGAVAVLGARPLALGDGSSAIQWIHPEARRVAGHVAARVYGEPARDMFAVGVTGTNGKTTTAHLIGHLLKNAGRRPAVLGTAGNRLADGMLVPATHTTPDAPALQRLLGEHRRMGGDSVVLEASSHALDQERTAGLDFDVAVFTNLSRDHLDYHIDLERYAEAKEKLFSSLGTKATAVVNADDPASERMLRAARKRGARIVTYSVKLGGDLCASHLQTDLSGTELILNGMGISRQSLRIPLAGRYNVENALAAAAVALVSGASPSNVLDGLAAARSAPGRLEPVPTQRGFTLLVDYAHSEDALENVCRVVRDSLSARSPVPNRPRSGAPLASRHSCTRRMTSSITAGGASAGASALDPAANPDRARESGIGPRLIVVFGCGGDRDRGKRAPMGSVVNRLADVAIVTSDNPRGEDPARIISEILGGMEPARAERIVEPDRRLAIRRAVGAARAGDVVLIAGKGHEGTQTIADQVFEFDDRTVALEALK